MTARSKVLVLTDYYDYLFRHAEQLSSERCCGNTYMATSDFLGILILMIARRPFYATRYYRCRYDNPQELESRSWVMVTAKVTAEKHKLYKGDIGPVLTAIRVDKDAEPAAPDVCTF